MSRADGPKKKVGLRGAGSKRDRNQRFTSLRQRGMELPIVRAESSCPAERALFWTDSILGITNTIEEIFYMYQDENRTGEWARGHGWGC